MSEEKQNYEVVESFAARVWKRLSHIDISERTKDKGGFTYLPWATAWGVLMENYPDSTFTFDEPIKFENGTTEIRCSVTIYGGKELMTREMWLPVMDFKNNSIADPTSRHISDTRMRCLVKCLALFGLGHFLYEGEDYPRLKDAPMAVDIKLISEEQGANLFALIEEVSAKVEGFYAYFGIRKLDDLPASRFDEAIKLLEAKRKNQ